MHFLAYGLKSEVYTWVAPLFLFVAWRLVKISDYIVEWYDY